MKHDMDGPADTRMMGIVHDALRRDLDRLRAELTTAPYPEGEQRSALAAHALWMMDFLHDHHAGEDSGLYPMVRAKNSEAAALLDDMDADHKRIDPAMTSFRAAIETWGAAGDDASRQQVLTALDGLDAVLRPHLDREESEAMPIVSRTITHRELHEWDQRTNIKPKSMPVLAHEGLWLLDGLAGERRDILLHEVPLIPRYIVLWGFGPGYRRRTAALWSDR
jgi:hemerythrin-like domain-containing protein